MNANLIASIAVSIMLLTASASAVTLLPSGLGNTVEPAVLTLDLD